MRRPLMYLTLSLATGIAAAYYMGSVTIFSLLGCVSALLLLKNNKKRRNNNIAPLLLAGFCLGIISFFFTETQSGVLPKFYGTTGVLQAQVIQVEERESINGAYTQIKARVLEWEDQPIEEQETILINCYENDEKTIPGDFISVKGHLTEPQGRRNPGCFDYALYLKSIGIRVCMSATEIHVYKESGKGTFQGRLFIIRESFLQKLEHSAGHETAGLMRGIMFGGKSSMADDALEEFQKNGTAHVLAVSGLHVGIIYGFISALWRWRKQYLFSGVVMVFFFCYMVMASFSPSVIRAVFMVALHLLATLTNRRYDMSSAAFLMAFVMLLRNPLQLFHTGFQMSFLAVLTLSLILPIVRRIYDGILLASVSVQIGLLPYTVYVFNYLSLAAVFVNVPVIFLTGIIVPAGLCSMAAMEWWDSGFDVISGILFGLCHILTKLNAITGIGGVTVFDMVSPPLWLVALYYLILLFFVSEDGRLALMRYGRRFAVRMGIVMVIIAFMLGMAAGNRFKNADIVFVDVGQGDCMHIRTEDAGDYLIDGGGSISYDLGKRTLKPYLLKNGVRNVEGVFVTHLHTDHYKGIVELCREGMVKRLFLYEGNRVREKEILKETGLAKEQITYLYKGQTVRLGEEAFVEVLWPGRGTERQYVSALEKEENENDSSMIMKTTVKGCSMLATADVDAECLEGLSAEWGSELASNILKAPHHGSKYSYSEAFTETSAPQYVVFQVGKNNFGHPDKGVVENYIEKGIMVYRNDEDGAVAFDIAGNGSIKTMTVKGELP